MRFDWKTDSVTIADMSADAIWDKTFIRQDGNVGAIESIYWGQGQTTLPVS